MTTTSRAAGNAPTAHSTVKQRSNQHKARQLRAQTEAWLAQLVTEVDTARFSAAVQQFLKFTSQFHDYSWRNTLLILLQRSDATLVAGFKRWRTLGRHVKRGETGIAILAPLTALFDRDGERVRYGSRRYRQLLAEDALQRKLIGYKPVYVFDVSQTEGEPLPTPPDWRSPAQHADLTRRLVAFADQRGITVEFGVDMGGPQGVSHGGLVQLAPEAGVKTLVHEITHELLHQGNQRAAANALPHAVIEAQAEGVAYVVTAHFGLHAAGAANYIALKGTTTDELRANLSVIGRTAERLIRWVNDGTDDGAPLSPLAVTHER